MRKKLFAIFASVALLCSFLPVFAPAETANALPDNSWINRAVINYGGAQFADNNTYDNGFSYTAPSGTDGCNAPVIHFTHSNAPAPTGGFGGGGSLPGGTTEISQNTAFYYNDNFYKDVVATLTTEARQSQGISTPCVKTSSVVKLANPDFRRITFVYKDTAKTQIQNIINNSTFTRNGAFGTAARYVRDGDGENCKDLIIDVPARELHTNDHIFSSNPVSGSATLYAVVDGPSGKKAAETYKDVSGGVQQTCYITYDSDGKYLDIMEGGYGLTASNDPGTVGAGSLVANGLSLSGTVGYEVNDSQKQDDAFIIFIGNADTNLQTVTLSPPPGASSSTPDGPSCEASGFSLSWLLCGISNALTFVSDWLLNTFVIPFLQPSPIGLDPADPVAGKTYQVWSAFRTYGNILLVIALIVAVISQAIDGGIVEAYTARKMLPRILVSAILINVSIYIVAFSVDISRIIGNGMQNLITAPLASTGNLVLAIGGGQGNAIGIAVAAIVVGAAATGLLSSYLPVILIFVGIPAALAVVGIFVTAVLLQGIIVALVIFSPVAFALYCLPNTEKYFRTWWDWFFRALLVFPIIMVIIGIAKLMTSVIQSANATSGGVQSVISIIIAFFVQFVPLLLIPFTFKLAGGLVGRLNQLLGGYGSKIGEFIKGNPNDPYSMQNKAKRAALSGLADRQARIVDAGRKDGASVFRRGRSWLTRAVSPQIDERLSRYNKEAREMQENMSATGRDQLRYAAAGTELPAGVAAPSFFQGTYTDASGATVPIAGSVSDQVRYFDSKGRKISSALYHEAKSAGTYGNTAGLAQGFNYTARKIQTDDDIANFRHAFKQTALQQGWTQDEIGDAWAAATFEYKPLLGSEWYSAPKLVTGAGGAPDIQYDDIGSSDSTYKKFVEEPHKTREAFKLGSMRDQDYRVMGQRQNEYEARAAAGTLTDTQAESLAMTSELMDTVVRKGMETGSITRNPDGELMISGVSPAAQGVLDSMYKNRKYQTAAYFDPATGRHSLNERVLYDRKAVEAEKAAYTAAYKPGAPAFDETAAITKHAVRNADGSIRRITVTGDEGRSTIRSV